MTKDLRQLWDEASSHGKVDLFSHDNGKVSCTITVHGSTNSMKISASSGYELTSPEAAISKALDILYNQLGQLAARVPNLPAPQPEEERSGVVSMLKRKIGF
jgi:hypothetical protein